MFGEFEDVGEVGPPQPIAHVGDLGRDVGHPRLKHVALGGLPVGGLGLLVGGHVGRDDREVVFERRLDPVGAAVLVVHAGIELRKATRDRAGGRRGAPAGDRRHLREAQLQAGGFNQRERGGRKSRRRGAKADVRGEGVLALEADGVLEARQLADVVDDHRDPFGRPTLDAFAVDQVGVLSPVLAVDVVEPLDGRRRVRRGGTDADRVVIRQPTLRIAHPVVLDESLNRVGSRGRFQAHWSYVAAGRGLVVAEATWLSLPPAAVDVGVVARSTPMRSMSALWIERRRYWSRRRHGHRPSPDRIHNKSFASTRRTLAV